MSTYYLYHYVNDSYLNNDKYNNTYVVKIGYTSNPKQRLHHYLTGSPTKGRFDKLYRVNFENEAEAMSYEFNFHKLMSNYRFDTHFPKFCSGGIEWYVFETIEECQLYFKYLLIDNYVDFTETFYEDILLNPIDYNIINISPKIIQPIENRETSQDNIIHKMILYYSTNDRGILNLPTGYGKTNISLKFCIKQSYNKILILVPKLKLLSQFYYNVRKYFESTQIYLIGCDTNSIKSNYNTTHFESTSNIYFEGDKYIVICVYNSCEKLKEEEFDFIIFDEAHHVATTNETNSFYQYAIFDNNIYSTHRLFLTATIKYIKFKKSIETNDNLDSDCNSNENSITEEGTMSMNNVDYFGNIIEKISLRQAIDEGVCCDYKVLLYSQYIDKTNEDIITPDTTLTPKRLQNKINQKKLEIRYDMAISNIYKSLYEYNKNKVILYFNKIDNCKKFIQMFQEYVIDDDIWIDYVSSNDKRDSKEKEILFKHFENNPKKSILCNVDIITEGVDIPNIDMIGFMDKCDSSIKIIQSMGRMLRKCGDKIGHIFIPDVVYKDQIGNGIYKKLRVLVRSLANIDYKLFTYNIIEQKLEPTLPKNNIEKSETPNELQKFMIDEQFNFYNDLHNKESDSFSYYPYQQCLNIIRNETWNKISDWNKKQIYLKDIRIPCKPINIYKSDGCEDMYMFLGIEKDIKKQYYQELNNLFKEFKLKNDNPTYDELVKCIYSNPVLYDYYIIQGEMEKQKINYYIMTYTLSKYPKFSELQNKISLIIRKEKGSINDYKSLYGDKFESMFYDKILQKYPYFPKIFHMAYENNKSTN